MSKLRCYTCLQQGRKLRPLKAQVKYLFALLCPEMFFKTKDTAQYLICWECEFMVDKIKRFQTKLKKANEILKLSLKGKATIVDGLSCLKLTGIQTISITLPPTVPKIQLPQNVPSLQQTGPQNVPTLPQNAPTLPQNMQDNMLAAPLRLDTQIKIEEEDEENSCNDFDQLIQSTTIPHITIGDDPLLVLEQMTKTWMEVEVPPVKEIKNQLVTPVINYIPQKVFINAPKEHIALRGSKEAVKVTVGDPNSEIGKESALNLLYKDKEKRHDKNDLLRKLLTSPSKGKLILKRPAIPNPNPLNEPECRDQWSDIYGGEEDEANVIILNQTELNALRDKKRSNPAYTVAPHRCERCIEWFNSQEKLDEHNLKHVDVLRGFSICEICEQRFADDNVRDEHYKEHFIMYECLKCPYRNSNRIHLSAHCRRKHEESSFHCRICGAVSKTFRERRAHMIQAHNQKLSCEECGKTFANSSRLRGHVFYMHKSESVKCPICKKMFKKHNLKNHIKTHNDTREDCAYCADCGTTYKSKYTYELHLKNSLKHNAIEKVGFKCDHCDKYFANKTSLKNHVEEIGGVRYICDICNKHCKSKRGVATHIQVVHERKKRKIKLRMCEICGKSFTVRKNLVEHLNTHSGVRPHTCKECGATFIYSAALFTHRRLVHKVKRKFEMTS